MNTYYIYKATLINDTKSYVGCTNNFDKRIMEHIRCNPKEDCVFHRAIEEFGSEKFVWTILETVYSKKEALEKEKYWIETLNTCIFSKNSNGYNENYGGVGGHNSRPVIMLNLNGEYIKRYNSASDAERDIGVTHGNILINCKNKSSNCNNYLFMFEDEYIKFGSKTFIEPKRKTTSVIQCDLEGNFIKKYNSVQEAAICTNSSRTSISTQLNHGHKNVNGFIFVYENEYPISDLSIYKRKNNGRKIAQVNIETNEIICKFDSISDAGKKLGVNYKTIQQNVDKPNRTAFGYKWISC